MLLIFPHYFLSIYVMFRGCSKQNMYWKDQLTVEHTSVSDNMHCDIKQKIPPTHTYTPRILDPPVDAVR